MNKSIDFTQNGGMPLTQDLLKFMQDGNAAAVQAIISLFGDNVILSGASYNGSAFSNGFVVYDGELLPFVGGAGSFSAAPSSQIISVFQTSAPLTFADGSTPTVKISRYVGLGYAGQNAKTVGNLIALKKYDRASQILLMSGVKNIDAVGTISIQIGQNIDVSKLNPVVAIQKTNNALPNKTNVYTGINSVISSVYFEKDNYNIAYLKIENNIDAPDLSLNAPKLIYHIFKDISTL